MGVAWYHPQDGEVVFLFKVRAKPHPAGLSKEMVGLLGQEPSGDDTARGWGDEGVIRLIKKSRLYLRVNAESCVKSYFETEVLGG